MADFRVEWEECAKEPNNILATGRAGVSESTFWDILRDILDKIKVSKNDIVLDIGCAHGLYDIELSKLSSLVVGMDYSKEFLHRAKRNLENDLSIRILGGDVRAIPCRRGVFTKVVCYNMFHYLGDVPTVKSTLTDIKRVCKPDAVILIGDLPNLERKSLYLKRKIAKEAEKRSFSAVRRVVSPLKQRVLGIIGVGEIPWHDQIQWFHPEGLLRMADDLGMSGEILQQGDRLPGHYYRFDLRLTVR